MATASVAPSAQAAPDKKALSQARKKFQRATELEQAGNFTSALTLFREVGEVKMTPQVRFHIAFCEAKLGKLVAALGGYELAMSEAASVGPGFEKEVSAAIDDLKAAIPKLVLKRGEGAAAASVELDGVALGEASIEKEMPVDPGPHLIEAKLGNQVLFSETVKLAEGETRAVDIVVQRDAVPPPETTATPSPETTSDTSTESPSRLAPILIGSVGIAALAASGVFYVLRNDAINELDDACGPNRDNCPASSEGTYDDAKRYNTFSQVALGVGIVGLATATTLWLTAGSPSKPAKAQLGLTPSAPGSDVGLAVSGRF
ncbi:MAG: hypothetical protein R3B13_13585 [Polyangiaceae bacterium]